MTEPTATQPVLADSTLPPLPAPAERGTLTLADRALERLAVGAARELDRVGVRASRRRALGPLASSGLPRASVRAAEDRVRITLDVLGRWPQSAAETAAQVRSHVASRVTELADLHVEAVDVTVADLESGTS